MGPTKAIFYNSRDLFLIVPGFVIGVLTGIFICSLLNDSISSTLSSLNNEGLSQYAIDKTSQSDLAMKEEHESVIHFGRGLGGAIRGGQYPDVLLSKNDGYKPRNELQPLDETIIDNDEQHRLLYIHTGLRNVDEIYSLELLIKSLLITQNLQFTKLIIWMDEDWIESKISDKSSIIQSYRYTPYQSIQFRRVDLKRLSQSLSQSCGSNVPLPSSDLLQIAVLSAYGGLWLDPDSVVLKDLRIGQPKQPKIVTNKLIDGVPASFVYVLGESNRRQLKTVLCKNRLKNSFSKTIDASIPLLSTRDVLLQCHNSDSCDVTQLLTPNLSDDILGAGMPMIPCNPTVKPEIIWMIPDDKATSWETSIVALSIPSGIHAERMCGKPQRTALDSLRSSLATLLDRSLGYDVRVVPVVPMSWVKADLWPNKPSRDEDIEFSILTIFTVSHGLNFNNRQVMRSQLQTNGWRLRDTTEERDFRVRLLFIVHLLNETDKHFNRINAWIQWESIRYHDIIILPPGEGNVELGTTVSMNRKMGKQIPIVVETTTTTNKISAITTATKISATTTASKISATTTATKISATTTATKISATTTTTKISTTTTGAKPVQQTHSTIGVVGLKQGRRLESQIYENVSLVGPSYTNSKIDLVKSGKQTVSTVKFRRLDERNFYESFDRTQLLTYIDLMKSEDILKAFDYSNQELGSLPRSFQTAVVKWSCHAESRYLLFLYSELVFVNLFAFKDFLGDLAGGFLFVKTKKTISSVIALPKIDKQHAEPWDISQQLIRESPKQSRESIFDIVNQSTVRSVKPSDLQLLNQFIGFLATRDTLSHLLGPQHPIRLGATVKNISECRNATSSSQVSYGENITNEDVCNVGYSHPINQRLKRNQKMFLKGKEVFVVAEDGKQRIHIHTPQSFNYTIFTYSQISIPLTTVLPSIARNPDCLLHPISALPLPSPKAALDLMRTFRSTLVISDIPCAVAFDGIGTFSRIPYGMNSTLS